MNSSYYQAAKCIIETWSILRGSQRSVQNRDPFAMVCNANVLPHPFPFPTWLYSHSYPAEVEDINSTIIGELGKTRRWYVPRIFQTSFNNFAVNSRWYSERWRGRIGKKKKKKRNERKGRNTKTGARSHARNRSFVRLPRSP